MDFIPEFTARDMPAPATPEEIAARFGSPVFTFAPQPFVTELGIGYVGHNDQLVELSISYTVIRNPDDPNDPTNFTDHRDESEHLVQSAEDGGQPDWFIDLVRSMRYPSLWEAVCTARLPLGVERTLADSLAGHMNHILVNTVEGRRRQTADGIPELDSDVSARHAQGGVILTVDGAGVDAIRIDTDPDVVGWAFDAGGCRVLVAFDRDYADLVDVALVQRSPA